MHALPPLSSRRCSSAGLPFSRSSPTTNIWDVVEADLVELRSLRSIANRPAVIAVLDQHIEEFKARLPTPEPDSAPTPLPDADQPKPAKPAVVQSTTIDQYGWDQTDKSVKLFVQLPGVGDADPELVTLEPKKRGAELKIVGLKGKNYRFAVGGLSHDLDIDNCSHKIKADMVLVFLRKKKAGQKWESLKEKVSTKKAVAEKSDDPSAGLIDMMRDLYNDGDDATKAMIGKAWTESREKKGMKDGPIM